jgi:Transglycosylase-like domain
VRKVLIPALCASAATVPAVAFAATNDDQNTTRLAAATTTPTRELRADAHAKLHSAVKRARVERKERLRRVAARKAAAAPAASPQLEAIAACESGGNPSAIGGGGAYRGKYQFDYGTWASVGGSGDPAAAPEAEQDRRAAILLQRSGTTPWPVCGQ